MKRWMLAGMRVSAMLLLGTGLGGAQCVPGAAGEPGFEVATVRLVAPASRADGFWSPPGIGKFMATSVSLPLLMQLAFGVTEAQMYGKEGWMETERYDVLGKPEGEVRLSREELKPRLRGLLRERFHLVSHCESRMVSGYELVAGRGGPKLTITKGDHFPGFRVNVSAGHVEGLNWTMRMLATALSGPAGRPVVDRTGLTGSYDVTLIYAADMEDASGGPSVFTALRETLGLDMRAGKVPVEVLVIDHVDRVPGEN